jgi:hypothetical protein
VDVRLWHVVLGYDKVKSGLTVSVELVMLGQVLLSVLVKLKEASGVLVDIGVSEVVELVVKRLLNEFLQFGAVLCLVSVELASRCLKLVGLSGRTALSNDLFDTTLNVGSAKILLVKKVGHQAHKSILGVADDVLVSHNVEGLSTLDVAVADQDLKELLH